MPETEVEHIDGLAGEIYNSAIDYVQQFGSCRGIPPRDDANANPISTAEIVSCTFRLRDVRIMNVGKSGVEYLLDTQQRDGRWTDPDSADPWDVSSTAWAVSALLASGMSASSKTVVLASEWLRLSACPSGGLPTNRRHSEANTYATAYTARALAQAGDLRTARRCLDFIYGAQNSDGGWGLLRGDRSEATLTGHVLHGITESGCNSDSVVSSASRYLVGSQKGPGLWPGRLRTSPSVEGTALCSYILLQSSRHGPPDLRKSLSFIAKRVRMGTAWSIGKHRYPWIAVNCMFLAAQVMHAPAGENVAC